MYTAQNTIDRIQSLIKKKNLKQKDVLAACNINENTLKRMTDNKGMSSFYLARIADYLDCSVDYLLGRSNQENISLDSYTLSQDEKTLINIFRTLPPESQQNILGFLDYTASVIINDQNTAKRAARSIKDKSAQTTSHQFNSADLDSIDDDNSNL